MMGAASENHHLPPLHDGHGVAYMFHSTAMVRDHAEATGRLGRLAGLRVLEYDERDDVGRRGGLTWIGDNGLEVGEPLSPESVPGRFVSGHGGGIHSFGVEVYSVDTAIEHLAEAGVRVGVRPQPGFFFTDPRDTHGLFVQWAHFSVPEDPRHGGALPDPTPPPLLDVRHQAFVGAIVDDPVVTARWLARLMNSTVTFEEPGAPTGAPAAGVSLGDCSLALFAMPGAGDTATWGRSYRRPRTHLVALTVEDLDRAAGIAAANGFGIVRHSPDIVVVDPATTGDVQIALVPSLLPGDPRATA
jgi:hypothetical protein